MYKQPSRHTAIAATTPSTTRSGGGGDRRNEEKALAFERSLFDWRSRHLILVLTLGYQEEWRPFVSYEMLCQHRSQLFANRRCNKLLREINGYVWKIEEGEASGGLHLHLCIAYSGAFQADVYLAQCIGEYWVDVITQGKGSYWNSNAQKEMHAKFGHGIGTGQIDRHDTEKRESLRKILLYLCKTEQAVSGAEGQRVRAFGTSQVPRARSAGGRGRD